jgi:hypothetical protein
MEDHVARPEERLSFWTRNRAVLVSCALMLVIIFSVGGYAAWRARRDSPAETITAIASAAMKGDADSVLISIDTTSVANSAVDDVLSSADEHALLAEYLKTHPDVSADQIKARAPGMLNGEIREHVESGTLPKRIPLGSGSMKAFIAEAVARRSVHSVRIDGNTARMVVNVRYKGKTIAVKVRMQRVGSTWKVDKIENMKSVLKQAGY